MFLCWIWPVNMKHVNDTTRFDDKMTRHIQQKMYSRDTTNPIKVVSTLSRMMMRKMIIGIFKVVKFVIWWRLSNMKRWIGILKSIITIWWSLIGFCYCYFCAFFPAYMSLLPKQIPDCSSSSFLPSLSSKCSI